MECPKCGHNVRLSPDQMAAIGGIGVTAPVMAAPYIATVLVMPYLAPVFLGGIVYAALRKRACPSCGHRFTWFQEGKS